MIRLLFFIICMRTVDCYDWYYEHLFKFSLCSLPNGSNEALLSADFKVSDSYEKEVDILFKGLSFYSVENVRLFQILKKNLPVIYLILFLENWTRYQYSTEHLIPNLDVRVHDIMPFWLGVDELD